jgi:hypothetical protein
MAMTVTPQKLTLLIGLACITPISLGLLFFSNRDPFLFGACLLVSLTIGPLSSIVLGLRKANSRKLFLWSLVVMNAAIPIALIVLIAYGWIRSNGGSTGLSHLSEPIQMRVRIPSGWFRSLT